MLSMRISRMVSGESKVDGVTAERFLSSINEDNPDSTAITYRVIDQSLYKQYKEQCREDEVAFEDAVYELCDEIKSEK